LTVNKRFLKTMLKIVGVAVFVIIALLAVGPFLVPVRPLEGLASAQQVAPSDSEFVTIPFEGTDGIDIHYLDEGSDSAGAKPTFVLLHGSLFNAFTWNQVIDPYLLNKLG